MVDLLLSLEKEFLPHSTPLNTWIKIAEEILLFLDDVYRSQKEVLIFSQLETFFSLEVAHHWGITIEYLQEVVRRWPPQVQRLGFIEPLLYNRLLLTHLLERWSVSPPNTPVITLGLQVITPLMVTFFKKVLSLDKGQIVINFDSYPSFQTLEPHHPLYIGYNLLRHLEYSANDCQALIPSEGTPAGAVQWVLQQSASKESLEKMTLEEHPHLAQEVRTIGFTLKHYYDHSSKRLAFIAPPGDLKNCLMTFLKKLEIPFSCSSSKALRKTPLAQLSWLTLSMALSPKQSIHALAFWNFCQPYTLKPQPITEEDLITLQTLTIPLQKIFHRFSFRTTVIEHYQTIINLFTYCTQQSEEMSWEDLFERFEGYETLTSIFEDIAILSLPIQSAHEYQVILDQAFETLLPCSSLFKERILLLHPFESLFLTADLVIIGDLNEGTWPLQKKEDMWLTPLLRKEWDLSDLKMHIGLEAQHFLHSCSAPEIIFSRSLKTNGKSTLPSRWLLQLQIALKKNYFLEWKERASSSYPLDETVLKDLNTIFKHNTEGLLKKKRLDHFFIPQDLVLTYHPYPPPRPCPPLHARPRRLSVTAIEQWMRDPYSIYARFILQLKPLEENLPENRAVQRGNFIHQALEQWMKNPVFSSSLSPEEAYENLLRIAKNVLQNSPETLAIASTLWWPRFCHIARWIIQKVQQSQTTVTHYFCEIKGKITLQDCQFVLTAEADRLDLREENGRLGWVIVDYKTGSIPSLRDIKLGFSPQLSLEALICSEGGFSPSRSAPVKGIEYWQLTGNVSDPGKIITIEESLEDLLQQTKKGLTELITLFDQPDTPYLSCPRPDKAPTWEIYNHLARRQEWS
jgi:ATP-dependent helicase/nuclease subunit B